MIVNHQFSEPIALKSVFDLLQSHPAKVLFTGSRYFGGHSKYSDWDFAMECETEDEKDLLAKLIDLGFVDIGSVYNKKYNSDAEDKFPPDPMIKSIYQLFKRIDNDFNIPHIKIQMVILPDNCFSLKEDLIEHFKSIGKSFYLLDKIVRGDMWKILSNFVFAKKFPSHYKTLSENTSKCSIYNTKQ